MFDDDLREEDEPFYIESYLQEDMYNIVRNGVYKLLGEDDTYLEVFEEEMKYSYANYKDYYYKL